MNRSKQYNILKTLPIPTIEGMSIILGYKKVLYGTLKVKTNEELKSITNKFDLLDLEYQFQEDFQSIDDINSNTGQVSLNFAIGLDKEKIQEFINYKQSNNHKKMGELLGYPDCCTSSFNKYFPNNTNNWTGFKIANYLPHRLDDFKIYPFYLNRLLRYSDKNALLYHFPCSLDCKESTNKAKKRFEILKDFNPKKAKQVKKHFSSVFIVQIHNNNKKYYEDIVDIVYYPDYEMNNMKIKINGPCYKGSPQTNTNFHNKLKNINTITVDNHNEFSIDTTDIFSDDTYILVFD